VPLPHHLIISDLFWKQRNTTLTEEDAVVEEGGGPEVGGGGADGKGGGRGGGRGSCGGGGGCVGGCLLCPRWRCWERSEVVMVEAEEEMREGEEA